MSESAVQRWGRRIMRPNESPPSEAKAEDTSQLLEDAQRRFVETFRAAHEKLGLPPLDDVRSKLLGELYGTATKATNE